MIGIERTKRVPQMKKRGWGRNRHETPTGKHETVPLPPAWPLGKFSWSRQVHQRGPGLDEWVTYTMPVTVYITPDGTVESDVGEPKSIHAWRSIDTTFTSLADRLLD